MKYMVTIKSLARGALKFITVVLISPLVPLYITLIPLLGKDRAFREVYEWVAFWPGTLGIFARQILCSWIFSRVGKNFHIGIGTLFSHADNVIGSDVYIGPACSIGHVVLGDKVLIASHVSIINGGKQHGYESVDRSIREQSGVWPLISIGYGAWIGERAVVMADVGEHSIVGAGAVVTKPIPPYCIVAGNPARILRTRKTATQDKLGTEASLAGFSPREATHGHH